MSNQATVVREDYTAKDILWWNYAETARHTGRAVQTIYDWAYKGYIKTRAHGAWRIDRVSVERWLSSGVPQGRKRNGRARQGSRVENVRAR